MAEQPSETTIFEEGQVRITNKRAIMGGKTYAMSNITSVSMAQKSSSAGCAIVVLAGSALLLPAGLLAWAGGSSPIWWFVFGAIGLALGFIWLRNLKPTYTVKIASASGEANALSSKDEGYIFRIVEAMNDAIVSRE